MNTVRQHIRRILEEMVTSSTNNSSEFMDDFFSMSQPHPLDRNERLIGYVSVGLRFWDGMIWISIIQNHGEKGAASRVMKALCDLADKHGLRMGLSPEPFGPGGLSKRALTGWYKSLGFISKGDRMVREPKDLLKENRQLLFPMDSP